MKTRIVCICLIFGCAASVHAQEYFTVDGCVRDAVSKRPIEGVTVAVAGKTIGTVTNADGCFVLKIPTAAKASAVECSHLGYATYRIPVNGNNLSLGNIILAPVALTLGQVNVYGWDAKELVRAAIRKIADNYPAAPNMLTGFYRETIRKRRNYINITEAVAEVYKTAYPESVGHDRVQVIKGRRLLSPRQADTLAVKLLGGPAMAVYIDIVKNPDVLLDETMLDAFSFNIEGISEVNGRVQYIVSFMPRLELPYPLYIGRFYIDRETLSFSKAEFKLDLTDMQKAISLILKKKPLGLRFRPEEVSYTISYRERGGKTYLGYLRNELHFRCDWRRRLFRTNYTIVSEMVITDVNEQPAGEIARKAAFRPDQQLSEGVADFSDADFWGAYNIIEPSESLDAAIDRLLK